MNPFRYSLAVVLLACLLSACGFHLRGQPGESVSEPFALQGINRFDGVAAELQRLAESRGIAISTEAAWSVQLDDEKITQWQASTNPGYNRNEYWLSLSVQLHIQHQAQALRPVSLKREALFQDDSDQLNSKAAERELIIQELRQQLANDVLQQLAYLMNNPPDCHCDED